MSFSSSLLTRAIAAGLLLALASQTPATAAKRKPAVTKSKPGFDHTGEYANFTQWKEVEEFIELMVSKHQFERAQLKRLLGQAHFVEAAIQLIKPAPSGKPKNWAAYRNLFVEPRRITAGLQFWQQHAHTLSRAESQYGVPVEVIVGIIGVETVYGKNTGNFRVLDVITTLAFSYPQTPKRQERMAFFRSELENALLLARETGVDPYSLRGSYAGAIGWAQFMPSSIRKYAVDFDGDGAIDIRNSVVDAIGSVANYLHVHGWRKGEPSVFPALLNPAEKTLWGPMLEQGLEAKYKLSEMQKMGVSTSDEAPPELQYGLIDLQNGYAETEYWIATNNFYSITKYNRSYFYAMSVLELGKTIRDTRQP